MNFLAVKAPEDSGGRNPIKTISVIANLDFHSSWFSLTEAERYRSMAQLKHFARAMQAV
jgi:hypothetical protein